MKAVAIRHGAIDSPRVLRDPELPAQIREMLEGIRNRSLSIVVFATHGWDSSICETYGWPRPDLILTRAEVGASKGSPVWVYETAKRLSIEPYEVFSIGDSDHDVRTAINVPVPHLHASWATSSANLKMKTLAVRQPQHVLTYLDRFLLSPQRIAYVVDDPGSKLHLRVLADAGVSLPCTRPTTGTFSLKDVLTHQREVQVAGMNARELLLLNALTSMYQIGDLRSGGQVFSVYPSSNPNKPLDKVGQYIGDASHIVHGYFKPDVFIRHTQAPDTSRGRYRGETYSIGDQVRTVQLNPAYRSTLAGKQVVVFDDFTTTGMSLEWARILLYAAGAERVTLLAIGKYRSSHSLYTVPSGVEFDPFTPVDGDWIDSWTAARSIYIKPNPSAIGSLKAVFEADIATAHQ